MIGHRPPASWFTNKSKWTRTKKTSTSTSPNPSKMQKKTPTYKWIHCPSVLLWAMETQTQLRKPLTQTLLSRCPCPVSPNHAFQHRALFGCLAMQRTGNQTIGVLQSTTLTPHKSRWGFWWYTGTPLRTGKKTWKPRTDSRIISTNKQHFIISFVKHFALMSRIFPPNVLAPVWELAQDHPNFNFKITFLQRKCGDRKLVLAPQISLHMKLKKNIPLHLTKTKKQQPWTRSSSPNN